MPPSTKASTNSPPSAAGQGITGAALLQSAEPCGLGLIIHDEAQNMLSGLIEQARTKAITTRDRKSVV